MDSPIRPRTKSPSAASFDRHGLFLIGSADQLNPGCAFSIHLVKAKHPPKSFIPFLSCTAWRQDAYLIAFAYGPPWQLHSFREMPLEV
jgi:hypothetical protein